MRTPRLPLPAFFVVLTAALALMPCARAAEPDDGAVLVQGPVTGRLQTIDGQRVLSLWGTPRERGYAHGWLMADRLMAGAEHDFGKLLKPFMPLYNNVVRTTLIPKFAFDAREREELEGLFEGFQAKRGEAGLRLEALGREMDLTDLMALNTFGDWYGLGCSSLAVWGRHSKDGAPRVGRNFDFPAFELVAQHQMVVVRAADGENAGSVSVSYPGCIGLMTGQSARGLFVSIHDVPVREPTAQFRDGNVPRLLALRRLLEQVQEDAPIRRAETLLGTWPTMYGNNMMVVAGSAAEGERLAAVLEYDGREDVQSGVTARGAEGSEPALVGGVQPLLACTNDHLLRQGLVSYGPTACWRYPLLLAGADGEEPLALDADALFARMARVAFPKGGGDLTQAEAILTVKQTNGFGTLHQVVGEPASGLLHIRLARIGSRVEREPAHAYDVPALVAALEFATPDVR